MSKKIVGIGFIFLLFLQLFAGCASPPQMTEHEGKEEKLVTLQVLTMGKEPTCGMNEFYDQLDKMTKKDLGCIVRFTYIPWGNEKQEIDIAMVFLVITEKKQQKMHSWI